uniref:Uncharacterized protein n=1 Tax=Aegilops tauschii subsp. strangulata TaxID=200361 RepID=A0A453PLY9_AEGTS
WRHSVVECTMPKCIWALATKEVAEQVVLTQEIKARDWIFSLIDKLPHCELMEALVTLWAIWHAQKKAI